MSSLFDFLHQPFAKLNGAHVHLRRVYFTYGTAKQTKKTYENKNYLKLSHTNPATAFTLWSFFSQQSRHQPKEQS